MSSSPVGFGGVEPRFGGVGFGGPIGYNQNQNQYGSGTFGGPSIPMPGVSSPVAANPYGFSTETGFGSPAAPGGYTTQPAYTTPGATPGSSTAPGAVPIPGAPNPTSAAPTGTNSQSAQGAPSYAGNPVENAHGLGHGQYAVPPQDQGLQNTLFNWLQQQIGQGVTPYGLSASLPSGGVSGPGQVASPLDPVSQLLESFFSTGSSSNPALQGLESMATTGNPVNATPEWQAMLAALNQQQDIGRSNVREQMSFTGNLPGSAGALAESQYQNQATLNNQSLIAQLTDQSLENAATRQQTAQGTIEQGAQTTGQNLYSYDQNAIQQLMNEYFQTTPQSNPLNSEIFSGATTYPPTFGGKSNSGIAGLIGSLVPALAGGAAAGAGAASGGAGAIASILAGLAAVQELKWVT